VSAASRRPGPPPRVRVYVCTAVALALLLAPASGWLGAAWRFEAWPEAMLLAALLAVAHRQRVQIGLHRTINVGTAPEVAAVLLLPGPLAVLALVAGTAAGERRGPLIQRSFNIAAATLRALAGLGAYVALRHAGPTAISDPLATLAAPLAMYVGGTMLVLGVAAV